MTFLDLFAGIGGFRLGMERASHICLGHCEIDKYANIAYEAIHKPKTKEWFALNIREVKNAEWKSFKGAVNVLCGGFPCQPFSIAGKRHGFKDPRGDLFKEITRAAEQIEPQYIFLENVKGLLSHDQGKTFLEILTDLDEIGFDVQWEVLNSKNFGVAQNRERLYLIGHSRKYPRREIFPLSDSCKENIKLSTQYSNTITARYGQSQSVGTYIIESKQAQIIQIPRGRNKGGFHENAPTITSHSYQDNNFVYEQTSRIYSPDGISSTLTTMQGGRQEPKILINGRIRKLTPLECWRLQGFPDWAFNRAKNQGLSDTQLYKLAGNSVTVNVIEEIAKQF